MTWAKAFTILGIFWASMTVLLWPFLTYKDKTGISKAKSAVDVCEFLNSSATGDTIDCDDSSKTSSGIGTHLLYVSSATLLSSAIKVGIDYIQNMF